MALLKNRVRKKRWGWNLVACGGRREAYETFQNARRRRGSGDIIILLVDSEGPVAAPTRVQHLSMPQGDRWDLHGVAENEIQLMIQTMEAWIVADPEALAKYYGQGFRTNALPQHANLESASKLDVANGLEQATRNTKKGRYQKIKHSSTLLQRVDPRKARARCPACERMFNEIGGLIGGLP